MGSVREVAAEDGGGSVHLGKVLPRGGTSGVDIWGRDLVAVACHVKTNLGCTCGFPMTGDREEGEKAKGWVLAEGSIGQREPGDRDKIARDLH